MWCKECNALMNRGTRYEYSEFRLKVRRYEECPKCHCRKYKNKENDREKIE